MVAVSPLEAPVNSQYDPDSAPNQAYNCGPTTVTNILLFHQDRDYPINETRRLATTTNYRGTTAAERKVMLDRRGTPAEVVRLSAAEVKASLNGRRALDLALLMGKIPLAIRKFSFSGSHSVEAIAVGAARCPIHGTIEQGIWINDPNFHRDRGESPRAFYPDHAWIPAYEALGGWVIRPTKDKVLPTRITYRKTCTTLTRLHARTGPGTNYLSLQVLPLGYRFSSLQLEQAGGSYSADGRTRRDWLSFNLGGREVWVARGYVREA